MQIVVIQTEPEIVVEVSFEDTETTTPLLETATSEVVSKAEVMVKEATILTDKKVITDNIRDSKLIIDEKVGESIFKKNLTEIEELDTSSFEEVEQPNTNRIVFTQPVQDKHNVQQELGQFVDSIREKYVGDVVQTIDKVDSKTGEVTYKPKDLTKCPQFTLAPIIKAVPVEKIIEEPIDEKPIDDGKIIEEPIIKEQPIVVKK